jgi:hypothetical protein
MGIRIEQPGAAVAAAGAGVAIGKSQRAEEDRARAEREQARAQAEAAQRAAQQKAMEFEVFKMEQRSMLDFQQELRDKQYEFDRFNRAKEWDIEKMELASRMDFQQDETKRLQELDRIDSKIIALDKAKEDGKFSGREFEFESMKFNLEQQRFGVKNPSRPLDPQSRMLDQMMRGAPGTAGAAPGSVAPSGIDVPQAGPIPVQKMEAIAAVGKTYITRKEDGVHVQVPIQNAKKAIETGRYEWPKVLGVPEKTKYPLTSRGFGPPNRVNFYERQKWHTQMKSLVSSALVCQPTPSAAGISLLRTLPSG